MMSSIAHAIRLNNVSFQFHGDSIVGWLVIKELTFLAIRGVSSCIRPARYTGRDRDQFGL